VLGGDVTRLLERVLEKVALLTPEWALCVVHGQRACAPLTNLAVGLGFTAPALSPQQGLGWEISRW
jgi:hypothetical protein